MTRPEIIRQDSIDLQERTAPSAQDHQHQNNLTSPIGAHQAEALRGVAAEAAGENSRSPRVSREWSNGEVQGLHLQQHDAGDLAAAVTASLARDDDDDDDAHDQQDDLAVAQNGGLTGSTAEDADLADAEGDDGAEEEDDMMDKISSSPSIDDGGCPLPLAWPERSDSLSRERVPGLIITSSSPEATQACSESESPSPLEEKSVGATRGARRPLRDEVDKDVVPEVQVDNSPLSYHHLLGEYLDDDDQPGNASALASTDPQVLVDSGVVRADRSDEEHDTESSIEQHPETPEQEEVLEHEDGTSALFDDYDNDDAMTIPYEPSEDDHEDDDYDTPYSPDSRFIDSGWGGECLQELEDIDFEFVYALHTFVATVEGQANATKGDTMVLLDDSNSYWWLVRVVKDSSIGYLPAEHIETPTERLARLNKHRNIDLTSTMLGDQADKPKNGLKKAIMRRAAKTVSFAAPTYVEASDVDYSTEEEDADGDDYGANIVQEKNGDQQEQEPEEEAAAAAEPAKARAEVRDTSIDSTDTDGADATKTSSDTARTSDEIFEGKLEASRSKNGTVRNTDSFFKDDTVETRKITLTPNLLRDDSNTSPRTSAESKEIKTRASLDKLEKDSAADKKEKKSQKDKKEKDKKPGMLSGLFKRKDKKSRSQDDDGEDILSGKESFGDSPVSDDITSPEEAPAAEVQRQPSKLQKQPRTESPTRAKLSPTMNKETRTLEPLQIPAPDRPTPVEATQEPSMRLVQPEANEDAEVTPQAREAPREIEAAAQPVVSSPKESKAGAAISKLLRTGSNSEPKPIKAKKAKSRVELDDFDSSEEVSPIDESDEETSRKQRPIPGSFPDSYLSTSTEKSSTATERLSESPVEVSPLTPTQPYPPPLMVDSSSQEDAPSPMSWTSPEPNEADGDDAREKKANSSTTSTSTAAWSDTHLRTFFEDSSEIKDLLTVVYDKSDVVPAGPDHPITGHMFRAENAKLMDITNRLDGLLGDWLARKMRTQASR